MTVGELVYQTAIKDGYNPEEISPELKKIAEVYQRVFDTMREPMKAVSAMAESMQEPIRRIYSVAESVRPQMEALSKIQFPVIPELPSRSFMPSYMYDEEGEFTLPEFTRPVQEVRIVNPEVLSLAPATQEREREYITASYQLPGNAKWESLEFQFIDGHVVRVSYPGMEPRKFDFKDMGFMNERTARPDMKWELLRLIASHGGSLTKNHWDRRFHRNIKYELAEGLRQFFGMTTSPIPRYNKRDGYTTLFVIREL